MKNNYVGPSSLKLLWAIILTIISQFISTFKYNLKNKWLFIMVENKSFLEYHGTVSMKAKTDYIIPRIIGITAFLFVLKLYNCNISILKSSTKIKMSAL